MGEGTGFDYGSSLPMASLSFMEKINNASAETDRERRLGFKGLEVKDNCWRK